MWLLRVGSSQEGCTTDRARVPCGENRGRAGVSATARGEFAEPGGDGLLIAQGLAPAGGARLAGADGVGLHAAARTRERGTVRQSLRRARTPGPPLRIGCERHRATRYFTIGGFVYTQQAD